MSALQRRSLVAGALLAITTPLFVAGVAHAAAPADCDDFDTEITQVVRPNNGTNLVTRSAPEVESAKAYGFIDNEGTLAKVASNDGAELTPVWRMYRPGDFVWAADGADANAYAADGYSRQFIEFYAATDDNGCLEPIQQLERNGIHRLAGKVAGDALVAAGWRVEGVAFYAVTGATPAPPPPPPPSGDTKFSIAVIPDTQNETYPSDRRFLNRANWLAGNKAALDLRYAMQIGDLSNWGEVDPAQYVKISNDVRPLEAAMPWAAAIGNHDTAAVCVGGSACPGANTPVTVRDTSEFNKYFPVSRFPNIKGTYEPGKVDNAYATFSAGGVDWMVLTLELWPRVGAINWAKNVVSSHPGHNVIVVTHAYLEADSSIGNSNGGYGATSPRYLFDNLIKVYPNVRMVLSGHTGQAGSRTDVGVNGNKIISFLQTFHNSTNPVRLVEIDTAADTVTSRIYAPYTDTDYPSYTTSTAGLAFD